MLSSCLHRSADETAKDEESMHCQRNKFSRGALSCCNPPGNSGFYRLSRASASNMRNAGDHPHHLATEHLLRLAHELQICERRVQYLLLVWIHRQEADVGPALHERARAYLEHKWTRPVGESLRDPLVFRRTIVATAGPGLVPSSTAERSAPMDQHTHLMHARSLPPAAIMSFGICTSLSPRHSVCSFTSTDTARQTLIAS